VAWQDAAGGASSRRLLRATPLDGHSSMTAPPWPSGSRRNGRPPTRRGSPLRRAEHLSPCRRDPWRRRRCRVPKPEVSAAGTPQAVSPVMPEVEAITSRSLRPRAS
jgi:hypothetical protein